MSQPWQQLPSFEVGLIGGPAGRWYRKARPEVDAMPWGSLPLADVAPETLERARRVWTMAAFQEYRTGAACARALGQLIEVSAPLDLIALCSRFPLDEMVHVELAARLLQELGGAVDLRFDPAKLVPPRAADLDPLLACAETMVRVFCVGEAVSIPILRASWQHAEIPLIREILGRIVKDEAVHGEVGFWFLDWCLESFDQEERAHLQRAAHHEISKLVAAWQRFAGPSADANGANTADDDDDDDDDPATLGAAEAASRGAYGLTDGGSRSAGAGRLGWMPEDIYYETAHRALDEAVLAPMTARGLDPRAIGPIAGH